MTEYIHQHPDWPHFHWNSEALARQLGALRYRQGRLLGTALSLGFELQEGTALEALTDDVQKSSEIEGEKLDRDQVRSSIARRLGIETGNFVPPDRYVDSVVEVVIDATRNFKEALTADRLYGWHAALFPTARSGPWKIRVGAWRDDSKGPMQVVSGPLDRERVHYQAPQASRLDIEMNVFLDWFNADTDVDDVLKAALAHVWFVMIHPFDDGNGRIGRAIADMALARAENAPNRFYSLSGQIMKERAAYYAALAQVSTGRLEITDWMVWFLGCLDHAIANAEGVIGNVFVVKRFWESIASVSINERQRLMLTKLLGPFEGKLTAKKWSIMTKCSPDTALRDIIDLIRKGILKEGDAGGRSTSYVFEPLSVD